MTLSLCRHDKSIMNNTVQCLQASAEDRKWRRRCDVLRKTVASTHCKVGGPSPWAKEYILYSPF